ncbi:uncharacterized protein LOC125229778 isoform X2 [Leguminivora glycinivorella]|uniref:uncharacterized protein LOC125229778 isoform X2 n=1 Tax=Leguminivora glycinivorella TaxID=1035111 RepID=UPI00200D10C2|nr:uncharacterized protein LOC125229778 isoform X2 [Leguminivora glycinivorella]
MATPNTNRSSTDTHDSNFYSIISEGIDNEEETELVAAHSSYNSCDIISNRIDQANCMSGDKDDDCVQCKTSNVPVCHIKLKQLENLKNSTKRLLCLLEDVQAKTHSTALVPDDPPKVADVLRPMAIWNPEEVDMMERSVTDIIGAAAMKRLEKQTKELDAIVIRDRDDDCSVYKRLTRKCHCLNQQEYNDFIIHFNEETKFATNTIGEIIKNIIIIKRFLYMGNKYTRNALMFLNQGLEEGTYTEKSEIIQACAFADICCIFDTYTIVIMCISWPCKNPSLIEADTQEMTAKFLYNLSRLEEGRRYLNFNAKITCDIKKLLKKKQDKISCDTIEMLTSVLNTCQPQVPQTGTSLTYHCRPMQEGIGNKTLNALIAYRQYMTLNELFMHLDILQNISGNQETKKQLTPHLPSILSLFRNMLLEFDNSDINIIVTNIMANLVGENVAKINVKESSNDMIRDTITSCIATEPIQKKNVTIQVPVNKRKHHKKHYPANFVPAVAYLQKKDYANKLQQNNPIQKPQQARKLNMSKSVDRPKTAPILSADRVLNSMNSAPLKPNTSFFQRENTTTSVYTAFINKSRKFMGISCGDKTNVIVVPVEQENIAVK